MTRKSLLALLLVSCMLLSGCSLVLKDQAVDNQLPIIEVNGQIIDKMTFNSVYEYNVYMEEYYNSMLASMFGSASQVDANAILEDTISSYVTSIVTGNKAAELGFDKFTAKEEAELDAQAQAEYDENLTMIQDMYFAGSELTGEELAAEVAAYAARNGLTLDESKRSVRSAKIEERLIASVTDLVADVDDVEIQALLDSKIAEEKEDYASSLSVWGASRNNGNDTYYTPAGYRAVRALEIAKPAEGDAAEAKAQADALHARITAGEGIDTLGETVNTYAVCESSTDLDAALVEAAMRIPAAGNISPVIETEGGYVIIEYVEDIAEHTATLEEVREQLHDEALTNKKNAAYTAAVAQWESEADVKIYRENLSL